MKNMRGKRNTYTNQKSKKKKGKNQNIPETERRRWMRVKEMEEETVHSSKIPYIEIQKKIECDVFFFSTCNSFNLKRFLFCFVFNVWAKNYDKLTETRRIEVTWTFVRCQCFTPIYWQLSDNSKIKIYVQMRYTKLLMSWKMQTRQNAYTAHTHTHTAYAARGPLHALRMGMKNLACLFRDSYRR